jgi:hypothetical protein
MKHDGKDSGSRDFFIDRTMAAFRAALTCMDASPAETARIRNLANATDAQLTAEAKSEALQGRTGIPVFEEPAGAVRSDGYSPAGPAGATLAPRDRTPFVARTRRERSEEAGDLGAVDRLMASGPTLSQRVYEHLRDEILADRLLPGTELSEVALSRELAIGRGPIREAMGRLAAEGLIMMRPRRRDEVRSLTPQELIDAYQVC